MYGEERDQQDATYLMFIHIHNLNIFRASLCPSSGEQDYYRIRCSALQQKEHI
jgi:hypothetical protein